MNAVETDQSADTCALLDPQRIAESGSLYGIFKRVQDVVLSALALAVLWPLMLVVAVIIVLSSPGASPIFSQTRVGKNGKEFTFYKFRSMHSHAEEELESLLCYNEMSGPVFKIKEDPRITRFGRFIRRSSIDELPQLWNVLKGDMSLVGPRPGLPREVAQYDDFARQRLLVTPGLTCYWQTQSHRNELSFDAWMALDVKYIQERSVLTDWKIMFATVGAVLGMNGE